MEILPRLPGSGVASATEAESGRPPDDRPGQERRTMTRLRALSVVIAAMTVLCGPSLASAQGDPAPRGAAGADRPGGANNPGGGPAVSGGNMGSSGMPGGGGWSGSSGATFDSGGGSFSPGPAMAIRRGDAFRSLEGAGGDRYSAGGGSAEIPWYSRSRGDRPIVGTPAGREGGSGRALPPGWTGGGNTNWLYWGYYDGSMSLPWYRYYGDCGPMYGFGGFGMGYFYYDPGWWAYGSDRMGCNPYGASAWGWDAARPGYSYGGGRSSRPFVESALKLKIKPGHAQVFVDGYFAGEVDEFDGIFQKLPLAAGAHRLEVRAPGYETLVFDVHVEPFQTVTHRAELRRAVK